MFQLLITKACKFARIQLMKAILSRSIDMWPLRFGKHSKKNSGYNEYGTKGGGVLPDLNHYLKQICNSEKGEGGLR